MKSLYWAWGAVVADAGLFVSDLPLASSTTAFIEVWLLHGSACAVLATSAFFLLPKRYQRSHLLSWLLMFDFAFIAPVVGPIGILLIIHLTLRRETDQLGHATPRVIELPVYDVQSKEIPRAGQGAIRSRLSHNVPADIRMKSLLTLQAVPSRVANPILETLLGDGTDDVRLVAFGMLDAAEKKLSVQIHREQKNLQRPLSDQARYDCLRHLAELHWELIDTGLVQGELRKHVLMEARQSLEAAMMLEEQAEGGLLFLKGKILLAQGEIEPAADALTQAMQLGQPETAVLPHLAELAFSKREFGLVREYLLRLMSLPVDARTKAIVDIWTGRDNFQQFRDTRILQHI